MLLNKEVDQKVFRTAYRQWIAAKNEQALITYHEAGFFRALQWKQVKHDKMEEKAIDRWFQFDYDFDLAKGLKLNISWLGSYGGRNRSVFHRTGPVLIWNYKI